MLSATHNNALADYYENERLRYAIERARIRHWQLMKQLKTEEAERKRRRERWLASLPDEL